MQNNSDTQEITPALELGMQELEAMEAPGFWSVTGFVSGAGVSGAVTYSVVATVIT
ncbi:daptide-type RiPP [Streptomyces flavidovirens]|uniref:daptide-type RiPP n=1 Tax=Streptomyces flavidovirens TaxID=67298 RepID=UPI00341B0E75